jgi:uncharacterized protein (TIGR02996 family)
MSDDEAALLRGVLLEPEADLPRLVYADWLEERGGEGDADRAEYIRLGVGTARREPDPRTGWEIHVALQQARHREAELLALHRERWQAPWKSAAARKACAECPAERCGCLPTPDLIWRRGFVEAVGISPVHFVGGACGECRGSGQFSAWGAGNPRAARFCPWCKGRGRFEAQAGPLFRRWPVTKVRLVQKNAADDRVPLVRELLRVLPPGRLDALEDLLTRAGDDAAWAMSRELVNYGRRLVGLPEAP